MSIHTTQLTSELVGGRQGYQLEEAGNAEYSGSNSRSINIEVWDDRFNIEWRTPVWVEEFTEILDRDIGICEEIRNANVVAWFGSKDVEPYKEEGSYPAIKDLEHFPRLCGNLRFDQDEEFQIYWQDTRGENTVEVTSYNRDFRLFEYLYEETAPEKDRIETGEVVAFIQALLEERS